MCSHTGGGGKQQQPQDSPLGSCGDVQRGCAPEEGNEEALRSAWPSEGGRCPKGAQKRHRGVTAASPAAVLTGMTFHCERCHWEEAGPQAQGSGVAPPGLAAPLDSLPPLCPPAGRCLGHRCCGRWGGRMELLVPGCFPWLLPAFFTRNFGSVVLFGYSLLLGSFLWDKRGKVFMRAISHWSDLPGKQRSPQQQALEVPSNTGFCDCLFPLLFRLACGCP